MMEQAISVFDARSLPSFSAKLDSSWDNSELPEAKMHSIHQYPAKFPSFIASKSFDYASQYGVKVNTVGDIFCGCGTVALEAELHGKNFIGFDISPVAVMIAKAKSHVYSCSHLLVLFKRIKYKFTSSENEAPEQLNNQRIAYWFESSQIIKLSKIKSAIDSTTSQRSKYRDAFYCIFSSILKPCSKWLSKSIKPQIDPNKPIIDPFALFEKQFNRFLKAAEEVSDYLSSSRVAQASVSVLRENILVTKPREKVDLIVSSPPYVTSYEYADLHQLSTLWLDYAKDYRDLRKGTIGSSYGNGDGPSEQFVLNSIGKKIVDDLRNKHVEASKIHSVARYYFDMEKASKKCFSLLKPGGMALFVVGDTEFKGVKINNCDHLYESMIESGFTDLRFWKRQICGKTLSPFRDQIGRFSNDSGDREVYHEEYVIVGRKK